MPDARCQMQDAGYRMPDAGYRTLVAGCWLLVTTYQFESVLQMGKLWPVISYQQQIRFVLSH